MGLIAVPPAIIEPAEVEDFGCPELFATGWALDIGSEVVSAVAYVEKREAKRIRCLAVARLYFPRSRWQRSLDLTLAAIRAGRVN